MAALQASWRRDRWVGRRRLWWRWSLWGVQQYGLQAAGVTAVCVGLWFAGQALRNRLSPSPSVPVPVAAAPNLLPTAVVPPALAPAEANITVATNTPPTPAVEPNNALGLSLKFDPALAFPKRAQSPVSNGLASASKAADFPNPSLISENWLHSKEP